MRKELGKILLVEDDKIDVMTIMRAFKEINVTSEINIAGNGEEALRYLNNHKNEKPSIIILDINMPRMNGLEFLKYVKNDVELQSIPVIILTTSTGDKDISESFLLGAAGYIVKPVNYQPFVDVMRKVNRYWTVSELPSSLFIK